MVNIRLIILTVFFVALGALMIYRVFDLQIIRGEDYLNDFQLKTTKVRSLASTRGNIYDRNGNLLAYNELAYNVTIEDVYESGRNKNANLNDTIYRLIQMIEKNGDSSVYYSRQRRALCIRCGRQAALPLSGRCLRLCHH